MSRTSFGTDVDDEQNWHSRYVLSPAIEIQALWCSEALATNVDTGEFFKLNPTAVDIVAHLRDHAALGEVAAALLEKYSVDRAILVRDVQVTIADLLSKGVVLRSGADP
jgi:hypothetical protein